MEIPKSWELKEVKRDDGKLDIVGKDVNGNDYRVRTTDGPEVTSNDLSELHMADRESYRDRASGVREYVDNLVAWGKANRQKREDAFGADLGDASEALVRECSTKGRATRPGMIDLPSSYGSTRLIRANWPKDWN